jgi:hypothetical protein
MSTVQKLIFQDLPGYQYKVLPDGIHQINEEEDLDILFVKPFPDSITRNTISIGFSNFRRTIQSFLTSEMWIDGSFVEFKQNPNDVDVVVFVAAHDLNSLPNLLRDEFKAIFQNNKHITKNTYLTDAYYSIIYPKSHPYFSLTERQQKYWKKWFGTTRTLQSKGFVKLGVPFE